MKPMLLCFILLGWFLMPGCAVNKPLGTFSGVQSEQRNECQRICIDMGMKLGAVVIILNSAGCVCEPSETREPASAAGSATAAGGMVAVVMATNAQQAARVHQQRR